MNVRYLSDEWFREQWESIEESVIGEDTSDCGGWRWDPPCGGCARCIRDQHAYYLQKEREHAAPLLAAGFGVADPRLVSPAVPFCGDYHDAWRHVMAGEVAQ